MMDNDFRETAETFLDDIPYKKEPYSSRNWGHSWHSLCSYHGKLKPSIAYFLIKAFTKPGDVVLDPLCGVGTIPFEACLQGRIGIGNDLSEMAYIVSKAKLEKPAYVDVMAVVLDLKKYIEKNKGNYLGDRYEHFGLNSTLPDYFEKNTYEEILLARQYFVPRIKNITAAEALVYSSLLHILHGNRPYALSRHSHPLTPYKPTGEFEYKNLIEKLTDKINSVFKNENMDRYCKGQAILGDYSDLKTTNIKADIIICSPPFADSIKFYTYNWMRLWMCGWEPNDFKDAGDKFLDNKQNSNFDIYYSFFEMCNSILKDEGKIILHLGRTKKIDMAKELTKRAEPWFDVVYSGEEGVQNIEKFGIKDNGGTTAHQYLFLQKK